MMRRALRTLRLPMQRGVRRLAGYRPTNLPRWGVATFGDSPWGD